MTAARTIPLTAPLDLEVTLAPLQRGSGDPTIRFDAAGVWRASRTPDGAATTHLVVKHGSLQVTAWGPGAGWALEHAPILVGSLDDAATFRPHHPLVADLARRHRGLRIARTEAVFEALVPIILEQKVPGIQAWFSYRRLVETAGEPAPGPAGLRLPPPPDRIAALPSWTFHGLGVERRRTDTLKAAASVAQSLDQLVRLSPLDAQQRIRSLPGIGPWSAAEVALIALGDADAVSLGDYHLPHLVAFTLSGRVRGTDAMMLELLEPYRGHRGRVVRLLQLSGLQAPRFGPRLPLRWIARS
jgi:3-methyladenine DNA glycosylase/8-oxoguanine DNA glycosylase